MQTATMWLQEQIFNSDWKNMNGEDKLKLFEQAKEMEKQQIIDAYLLDEPNSAKKYAEQYYNETYKQELTSQLPGINVNDVKPSNPQMVKDIF